ncbi:hypothetical protein PF005_g14976 [Phytophthora fragariae]|uniref:Mediator complex subunit 15 KIX domain-containing protein n=1 Tax=Phytophthora fragariae TaxID=53985 RepID=A0A6A3TJX7_9STRA|nr:hypothetical protein PF003_g2665 [Phytophthora fragariae]KAE8933655.1 hypothetical protein PF009_g16344 [Phytophthora fragariae]KAE9001164.1 hypothetical protein PF011_g13866 [Phytophthora fragariae]KAE9101086.1 hypothetical protein PF007_g15280 [Phytophthora fragariae]KAE9101095.1 hypothetical protein PF010_g14560 [Phytophthora fragariae]
MQGPTPAAEPAAEPPQPPKKAGSTRARKATPRARAKKPADGKTPRRRASPRNRKAAQEEEKDKEKEENVPPSSSSLAAVKEEGGGGEDTKEEATVEKTEVETEVANQQETASAAKGEEQPPVHDTQLRKTYLQRMYRQLQSTHPNQDDAMIRQIATNVEMEACQKSATQSQYVAAMNNEIHKLMQFEMEQANASVYTNDDAQSYQNEQSAVQGQQPVSSSEMRGGYAQHQISRSHSYEYAQALAKAQEQEQANSSARSSSFSTPRQSMSGDVSFQSLMENQNQGYGRDSMQNTPTRLMGMQNLQQIGNQFYSTSSMTPPTSQSYAIQSNVSEMTGQSIPRNMMEAHQQQLGNFQTQQQQTHHPGSIRHQTRVTTFQEFTAQIQHLDKSVLIELLWNQRSALARWQNQAKQLELQLSAQQTAASNMGSPGFHSPYNSPMVSGGTFVSPNIAAEAEMQRARERNNSRMTQLSHQQQQQMPQYSYSQQSTPNAATYPQADGTWGENPQLYWQRIRNLKTAYDDQLRTAQRALAHNTVPPNSAYSMKAQSMMQNISLVLNILNEPPTNVQPRKFEVLNSIERFLQMSVVPIVQKVLSSGSSPQVASVSQAAVTSGSSPAMTTNAATYSPSVPTTQDNVVGMSSTFRQGTDNQYTGARWASSSSNFNEMETSRQRSRGIFADVASGDANGSTQMIDGLTAAGNSPNSACAVREESDTQSDTSMGQNMVYEAPTMILKEPSTLSLPALESRPSTITDSRLSSGTSLLSPGSVRDNSSSKVMDSASVDDDFSDFPVLEFEDPVADGNSFVKENNPSNVSRKRGIEDV